MKVICSKELLADAIAAVQKAVSSKPTMEILDGILLEANERFKLTGNDLELGIECFVEANIEKPGSIVINSRMFGEIIRKLPHADILITLNENNIVSIECENSYFKLKGVPSEGYPSLPQIAKENSLEISQKNIRDMIRQTLFAVSDDENKPAFNGSLVESLGNEINIVSIDGYRMAVRNTKLDDSLPELDVVVPGKTLSEIVKILQPIDEKVVIYSSRSQILFDTGDCRIVSRLLEAEYLDYRNIVPKDYNTKVRVSTEEILSSAERASLISSYKASSKERDYPIKLEISDDNVIISSVTQIGSVTETVHADIDGRDIVIGFNPRYFIDSLKVIEDEEIELFFTDNIGPCIIKPLDGNKFTYMVLPVKISN